jgi:hypothetical protein
MTEARFGPLRQRMTEDMTIRKFAPRTKEGYIRAVKRFSMFFGASPGRTSGAKPGWLASLAKCAIARGNLAR